MKRLFIGEVGTDWRKRNEDLGLSYHTNQDGSPYWVEDHCYEFTKKEIERLASASEELYSMMVNSCKYYLDNHEKFPKIFSDDVLELIKISFERNDFAFYGRFDLGYDGENIKLFELNSDTPYTALEAGPVLKRWRIDHGYSTDDLVMENMLKERMCQLKEIIKDDVLFFSCFFDAVEDRVNMEFIKSIAEEVGIRTSFVDLQDIVIRDERIYDKNDIPINKLFKFYPWDYIIKEVDVSYIKNQMVIEPLWRVILYKNILPVMSILYPDHPLLLKASFAPLTNCDYIKKPMFLREGMSIELVENGTLKESSITLHSSHLEAPFIYQECFKIPNNNGFYSVIGSWVVGDKFAGIGVRDSKNLITDWYSLFTPYYLID